MPATDQVLYEGAGITVGEFRCPASDDAWRELNQIGPRPLVVFPGPPVLIAQARRTPVLATRNHLLFYNGRQAYRRELRDRSGDHCVYLSLHPALAVELLAAAGGRARQAEAPFGFVQAASDARLHLGHALLVRHLRCAAPDPLAVEEALHGLLAAAVRAGVGRVRPTRRQSTVAGHAGLVEGAKALLVAEGSGRLSLEALASRLHASPFHLARVFREQTGFSLVEYRLQLRLRAALSRVLDGEQDLAALAAELGFASHSHLCDRFRRAFGRPPSALRRAAAAELRGELRRIVEAAAPVPA